MSNQENCLTSTLIPNPAVFFKEDMDGWGILVNLDTAAAIALNSTGAAIWKLIDGQLKAQDIVAAIREQFWNAPPNTSDEVMSILDVFDEEGMVGHEVKI